MTYIWYIFLISIHGLFCLTCACAQTRGKNITVSSIQICLNRSHSSHSLHSLKLFYLFGIVVWFLFQFWKLDILHSIQYAEIERIHNIGIFNFISERPINVCHARSDPFDFLFTASTDWKQWTLFILKLFRLLNANLHSIKWNFSSFDLFFPFYIVDWYKNI